MDEVYRLRRRPFYFTALILYVLALAANVTLLKTPDAALFLQMNEVSLVSLVPLILAVSSPARWTQWIGGLGMLAFAIYFTIAFSGTLT